MIWTSMPRSTPVCGSSSQARIRRERQQAQRQALEAARQHGLAARHRAKLARPYDDDQPDDAALRPPAANPAPDNRRRTP
jgi:hypothetical protein